MVSARWTGICLVVGFALGAASGWTVRGDREGAATRVTGAEIDELAERIESENGDLRCEAQAWQSTEKYAVVEVNVTTGGGWDPALRPIIKNWTEFEIDRARHVLTLPEPIPTESHVLVLTSFDGSPARVAVIDCDHAVMEWQPPRGTEADGGLGAMTLLPYPAGLRVEEHSVHCMKRITHPGTAITEDRVVATTFLYAGQTLSFEFLPREEAGCPQARVAVTQVGAWAR